MSVLDVVDNTLEYEEVQESKRRFTLSKTKPTGIKITTTQTENNATSRSPYRQKGPKPRDPISLS